MRSATDVTQHIDIMLFHAALSKPTASFDLFEHVSEVSGDVKDGSSSLSLELRKCLRQLGTARSFWHSICEFPVERAPDPQLSGACSKLPSVDRGVRSTATKQPCCLPFIRCAFQKDNAENNLYMESSTSQLQTLVPSNRRHFGNLLPVVTYLSVSP